MVLLAALLAGQMAGAGYLLYQHVQRRRAIAVRFDEASRHFAEARRLYDSLQFGEAEARFAELADRWWKHSSFATVARSYELLAAARSAMSDAAAAIEGDDFSAAIELHQQAARDLGRAAALDLPEGADELPGRIRDTREELTARRRVASALQRIDEALSAGEVERARRIHQRLQEAKSSERPAGLTAVHRRALGQLGERIRQRGPGGGDRQTPGPDSLATNEPSTAPTDDPADAFEPEELPDPYERLLRSAEAAIDRSEPGEALWYYQQAEPLAPDDQGDRDRQRLAEMRARIAYQHGRQFERQSMPRVAWRKYAEALEHYDLPEARRRLARLPEPSGNPGPLPAARDALAAGELDRAVRLFEEAAELAPEDERIREGLRQVRLRQQLAAARSHIDGEAFEEAEAALERARSLADDSDAIARLERRLEQRRRYRELITAGDEHHEEQSFRSALRRYEQAIALAERAGFLAADARQRRREAIFTHRLTQGQAAAELGMWHTARRLLSEAQRIRPDDEALATLLGTVERQLNPEAGAETGSAE